MAGLKELVWVGSSRTDLRGFPEEVQDEVGYALHEAQSGLFPDIAKPLKGFNGVFEIISDSVRSTFRAVYATKIGEYIYVLHVFQKKSTIGIKTPKRDIELIRQRLMLAQQIAKGEV